jgi:hypothetical protein
VGVVIAACDRPSTSTPTPTPTPTATATPTPTATPTATATATASASASAPASAAASAYASSPPLSGKSVGHTSVVFKLTLEGGVTIAYKPRSTRGGNRYKGEIAAYRLARALGLDNVPLAMPRSFAYDALRAAVGQEKVFGEVVQEPDGTVRGALIPWIKGLEFLPLETADWMPKWRGWLKDHGGIPDDQRPLAAQISTVLAFDQVTGNWDRWSGGNVGIDRGKNMLLYVDNDGAFLDPVPERPMAWPAQLFGECDLYSRAFVTALRGLDVASATGDESPGTPLLSARQITQAEARRKKVLAAIDAKIDKRGEADVLAFP